MDHDSRETVPGTGAGLPKPRKRLQSLQLHRAAETRAWRHSCRGTVTHTPVELSTHLPTSTDDCCSSKCADFCTPHIVRHTAVALPSVTVLLHTTHRTAHCGSTTLCNSSSAHHIVRHTTVALPSVTVLHTTHRTAHCGSTALCNSSSAHHTSYGTLR